MSALGHLEFEHPKLIAAGYVAHLSDLVLEDIFRMIEAGCVLKNVRSVVVLIKLNCRLKKNYTLACITLQRLV